MFVALGYMDTEMPMTSYAIAIATYPKVEDIDRQR